MNAIAGDHSIQGAGDPANPKSSTSTHVGTFKELGSAGGYVHASSHMYICTMYT